MVNKCNARFDLRGNFVVFAFRLYSDHDLNLRHTLYLYLYTGIASTENLAVHARSLPMKSSNRRSEWKRRAGERAGGRTSLSLPLRLPSLARPSLSLSPCSAGMQAWTTTTATAPHRSFPIGDICLLSPCDSLHVSSLGPAQSHTTQ